MGAVLLCGSPPAVAAGPAKPPRAPGAVPRTTTTTTSTTSTTFCTTRCTGRAVRLARPTGSYEAGRVICLNTVEGACVAIESHCPTPHLHRRFLILGMGGVFPDPDTNACGHGTVEMGHPCGTDVTPACD